MRAIIDGISFDEAPRDYSNAFVIAPQGLVGWLGGVTPRFEAPDRPTAHGSFDAPGFLSGRIISITGTILGESERMLEQLIEQLTGLLADGGDAVLSVQDDVGPETHARVRLAAETVVTRHGDGAHTAEFQVQFRAPDPRRYGERREFTGTAVVPWQRGNFPAIPTVTVTGPFASGYRLTYGAKEFRVTRRVPSGGAHVVDMRTGWVYEGGIVRPGAATRAELFTIPRGRSSADLRVEPIGTGGGRITVALNDTYI